MAWYQIPFVASCSHEILACNTWGTCLLRHCSKIPCCIGHHLYRSRSTPFMVLAPCDYQNLRALGFDQRQIAFTRQRIHIEFRDMSLTRVLSSARAMITAIRMAVITASTRNAWPVDSNGCG